jgi:hypothetical protein
MLQIGQNNKESFVKKLITILAIITVIGCASEKSSDDAQIASSDDIILTAEKATLYDCDKKIVLKSDDEGCISERTLGCGMDSVDVGRNDGIYEEVIDNGEFCYGYSNSEYTSPDGSRQVMMNSVVDAKKQTFVIYGITTTDAEKLAASLDEYEEKCGDGCSPELEAAIFSDYDTSLEGNFVLFCSDGRIEYEVILSTGSARYEISACESFVQNKIEPLVEYIKSEIEILKAENAPVSAGLPKGN